MGKVDVVRGVANRSGERLRVTEEQLLRAVHQNEAARPCRTI